MVVVGDQRQLPPSPFFKAGRRRRRLARPTTRTDDGTACRPAISRASSAPARPPAWPQRMLRWHYRSRHPSLIAVSNREFYDDRLHIVPSPFASHQRLGLVFRHVAEGSFERGGSGINRREAEAVARAVIAHARTSPELSLGVGCFSLRQRDAILAQLEHLWRDEPPEVREFFAAARRRAVLRQEPRDHPGRRARRDPDLGRLRARSERLSGDELRPAQPRGRRAPPQRPDHPRPRSGSRCSPRSPPTTSISSAPAAAASRSSRPSSPMPRPACSASPRSSGRGFDSPFEAEVARASRPGSATRSTARSASPASSSIWRSAIPAARAAICSASSATARLPQRALGARSRPAAPAGAGGPGLDPASDLEHRLAARSRWPSCAGSRPRSRTPGPAGRHATRASKRAAFVDDEADEASRQPVRAMVRRPTSSEPARAPSPMSRPSSSSPARSSRIACRPTDGRGGGPDRRGRGPGARRRDRPPGDAARRPRAHRPADRRGGQRGLARAVRQQRITRDERFYCAARSDAGGPRSQPQSGLRRCAGRRCCRRRRSGPRSSRSRAPTTAPPAARSRPRSAGCSGSRRPARRLRALIEAEVERLLAGGRLDRQGDFAGAGPAGFPPRGLTPRQRWPSIAPRGRQRRRR